MAFAPLDDLRPVPPGGEEHRGDDVGDVFEPEARGLAEPTRFLRV